MACGVGAASLLNFDTCSSQQSFCDMRSVTATLRHVVGAMDVFLVTYVWASSAGSDSLPLELVIGDHRRGRPRTHGMIECRCG